LILEILYVKGAIVIGIFTSLEGVFVIKYLIFLVLFFCVKCFIFRRIFVKIFKNNINLSDKYDVSKQSKMYTDNFVSAYVLSKFKKIPY